MAPRKSLKPWNMLYLGLGLVITLLTVIPFIAVLRHATFAHFSTTLVDPFFIHILQFSCKQAFFSAALSVCLAIGLARALARRQFWGREILLHSFELSLVLPVIVFVFCLIEVHGQQGYLKHLLTHVNWALPDYLYGLGGILLIHCCLNTPFASRVILTQLEKIPAEKGRLAYQLGFSDWQVWRQLDWPCIRPVVIELFLLVFFLCFTSFTAILALGGGPKSTTLEVAIYHALHFHFDMAQAGTYALIQFVFCLLFLYILSRYHADSFQMHASAHPLQKCCRPEKHSFITRCMDSFFFSLVVLFYLPLFLAIVDIHWTPRVWDMLRAPVLWNAIQQSLFIAITCGLASVVFALWIAQAKCRVGDHLKLPALDKFILFVPPIVLATGWFALLHQQIDVFAYGFLFVCIINMLMALPFITPLLNQVVASHYQRYHRLACSLGIERFHYWRYVDWPTLKTTLLHAFSLACLLSMGDMSVLAFFHTPELETLPWLLYQQLGHYQQDAAQVTALVLTLFSLAFLVLIRKARRKVHP